MAWIEGWSKKRLARKTHSVVSDKGEIRQISEIKKKYPDEWVVVDITQRDRYGVPYKGKVLEHSPQRDDGTLTAAVKNRTPEQDIYLFYGGL